MAAKSLYYASVEVVLQPVVNLHPLTGGNDITGETVQIALPEDGTAPSTWKSTTWETGTWWKDGVRYALAKVLLNTGAGFTLTANKTYRVYVKVGTGPVILKGGQLIADAT